MVITSTQFSALTLFTDVRRREDFATFAGVEDAKKYEMVTNFPFLGYRGKDYSSSLHSLMNISADSRLPTSSYYATAVTMANTSIWDGCSEEGLKRMFNGFKERGYALTFMIAPAKSLT